MPDQGVAQLLEQFEGQRPIEVAEAIRELPAKRRFEVVKALDDERLADVLQELPEDEQADVLRQLEHRTRRRRARGDGSRRRRRPARHDDPRRRGAVPAPDGSRGLRGRATAAEPLARHRGRLDDVRARGARPRHHRRRGAGAGPRSRPDASARVAGVRGSAAHGHADRALPGLRAPAAAAARTARRAGQRHPRQGPAEPESR